MSYSYLFKKAGRILKSYLNSTVSNDFGESERQRKIFEEYIREEANRRARSNYQSYSGTKSEPSGGKQNEQQRKQTGTNIKNDEYYFGVLGLKTSATNEEIKKAYKLLMFQYHPDKTINLGIEIQNLAKKKTQEINEAYNYIRKKRNF